MIKDLDRLTIETSVQQQLQQKAEMGQVYKVRLLLRVNVVMIMEGVKTEKLEINSFTLHPSNSQQVQPLCRHQDRPAPSQCDTQKWQKWREQTLLNSFNIFPLLDTHALL
jgi:hypothetical protein